MQDTAARTLPFFHKHVIEDLKTGKNIIISAHGNSLRSIVMELDTLSREEVVHLNIPTGIPIVYEFDNNLHIVSKEIVSGIWRERTLIPKAFLHPS